MEAETTSTESITKPETENSTRLSFSGLVETTRICTDISYVTVLKH